MSKNPLEHCEMILLKEIHSKQINPENCKLYVNVEPCLMCASALE